MKNQKADERTASLKSDFVLYTTDKGSIKLHVRVHNETIWMPQKLIVDLFKTTKSNISEHLSNIYKTGELERKSTVRKFRTVQKEGLRSVTREVEHYNLDVIIAVGYRVNSKRATQFRIWATKILKEFIIKGFAMDDNRLKQSRKWDYFDEWLARIRDIRASEKRFYQKIKDLYVTAVDYDKNSEQSQDFFKKAQNKMIWSVTGKTAAELIADRSDPKKPNMGLRSWLGSIVRKQDVAISKNYLKQEEIEELNHIVTMYLDYAELQAKKRQVVTMREWEDKLDAFLKFNERSLLNHAGQIKAEVAKKLAEDRYEIFDTERKTLFAEKADSEDIKELEALVTKVKMENMVKNKLSNSYNSAHKNQKKYWILTCAGMTDKWELLNSYNFRDSGDIQEKLKNLNRIRN
ncbi:MAG: virulence RhuM family protein [Oligoflexia bacterium]|nr:virulence RhuM family protein [Oligoflexia bacterium]